jgi:exo-1,4-beta-D-glucosaminidase
MLPIEGSRVFYNDPCAKMTGRQALIALAALASRVAGDALVSKAGDIAAVPQWDIQSSSEITDDIASIAQPGVDTSSWHHIPIPRCTLMGCLLEAGLYKEEELWYSNTLESFNWGQFTVPWLYRQEFSLDPQPGQHYFLETNGISSRADIYLNGELIADKEFQSGSYSGHTYDITNLASDVNALVIQAYPTDYFYDLALSWVDWNPRPADNGTGVWREITVSQTGAVSLGPLSALVDIDPAHVALRTTALNLEDKEVEVVAKVVISEPNGGEDITLDQTVTLAPGESKVIEFNQTFESPQIWWPKTWGEQPLYSAKVSVEVDSALSDTTEERTFGLRTVTSIVNDDDDIVFSINGKPFQVIGGGYGSDMYLRWNGERFESIVKYMLDMGLNTIRLEGKNEHPELYEIADRYGLMVMAGWECCAKWEAWEYNPDLAVQPPPLWDDGDYADANSTMWHEAQMLQTHPSMLAFLIGSDFWPNDRATEIYVNALRGSNFQLPIVPAASKRGYPELLGPSGMKMDGPYDWVPPNYWYDVEPYEDRTGAAFGFGSELGSGAGTPELGSLKKFLSEADLEDLWTQPEKGLFHMSTNTSQFYDRIIYNEGLYKRYGEPKSLEDYLRKAQVADYEAVRSEFEGFASRWSTGRVATGIIYWMLDNAWPSLHWNLFDRYLHPAGTFFGTKVGARFEHVLYNYVDKDVWLINHSLDREGARTVDVDVIDLSGKQLAQKTFEVETKPNVASKVGDVPGLDEAEGVVFLRLVLRDGQGESLSRNVYWVAKTVDTLDWEESTWYHTPVTEFADYTALFEMDEASVKATTIEAGEGAYTVTLENESELPAFFIRLNLVDANGDDVVPVTWSDNYVTLWPQEKIELKVHGWDGSGAKVAIDGGNVAAAEIDL